MKRASAGCTTAEVTGSNVAIDLPSAAASGGGATRYPRRSVGNSTFEKVPT